MVGTSVRIIKGLRLRTPGDDKPTVEEKLEENQRGDNHLKVESKKEKVESCDSLLPTFYFLLPTLFGDNLNQINKSEKINLSSSEKNKPSKVTGGEEKRKNPTLNLTKVENKAVNSVTQKEINWQSYPYNSSNEKKLQERASKVKEIIFNCGTSNELIKLENEGKISEREITWLKKNVLTTAERELVLQIESTRQGNLFSIDANQQVVHYDYNDLMRSIDSEMKRLNWSKGEGKDYLIKTYGVKSRLKLKDSELVEFLKYLERQ